MRIVFRADASRECGTGHVMRCLALADELARRGHEVYFVSRSIDGVGPAILSERSYNVAFLPPGPGAGPEPWCPHAAWLHASWELDAQQTLEVVDGIRPDWVVVDNYALDANWERKIQSRARRILAIDDVADRPHAVDVLLDQNLNRDATRYADYVNPETTQLLGPSYALLRDEFRVARRVSRVRTSVGSVLVFFGGSDPHDVTSVALDALVIAGMDSRNVHVVLGLAHKNVDSVLARVEQHPTWHAYTYTEKMADVMRRSDLCVGASGSATWERAAVGLPALIISTAENQVSIAEAAQEAGLADYVGRHDTVDAVSLGVRLAALAEDNERIRKMSRSAFNTTDGLGVRRVADVLEGKEVDSA